MKMTLIDWLVVSWLGLCGGLLFAVGYNLYYKGDDKPTGNYSVQCAVVTPSGPVPTVSLKGEDVIITDFGIVKMKEGLYIPTVSEICLIKKEGE